MGNKQHQGGGESLKSEHFNGEILLYFVLQRVQENFPYDCVKEICSYMNTCGLCNSIILRKKCYNHSVCIQGAKNVVFNCVVCGREVLNRAESKRTVHRKCEKVPLKTWKKMNLLNKEFMSCAQNSFACHAYVVSKETRLKEVVVNMKISEDSLLLVEYSDSKDEDSEKVTLPPSTKSTLEITNGIVYVNVELVQEEVRTLKFLFRIDMLSKVLRVLYPVIEVSTLDLLDWEKFPNHQEKYYSRITSRSLEIIEELRTRHFSKVGIAKHFFEIHGMYGRVDTYGHEFKDLEYFEKVTNKMLGEKKVSGKEQYSVSIHPSIGHNRTASRPLRSFYSRLYQRKPHWNRRTRGLDEADFPIVQFTFCLYQPFDEMSPQPPYSPSFDSSQIVCNKPGSSMKLKPLIYFDGVFLEFDENEIITPKLSFSEDIPAIVDFFQFSFRNSGYLKHLSLFELIHTYNTQVAFKKEKPRRFSSKKYEKNAMDFVLDFLSVVAGDLILEKESFYNMVEEQKFFSDLFRFGEAFMSFTIPNEFYWNNEDALRKELKKHGLGPIRKNEPRVFTFRTHKEIDRYVKKVVIRKNFGTCSFMSGIYFVLLIAFFGRISISSKS